jgi:hypothetical protein
LPSQQPPARPERQQKQPGRQSGDDDVTNNKVTHRAGPDWSRKPVIGPSDADRLERVVLTIDEERVKFSRTCQSYSESTARSMVIHHFGIPSATAVVELTTILLRLDETVRRSRQTAILGVAMTCAAPNR